MEKLLKPVTIIFITISVSFFILSCTPSLVYDPSINLPPEPLNGGHFQVSSGIGLLPEARPHKMGDNVAIGQNFIIRYSPFDRFTLQVTGWKDRSNNLDKDRTGLSYSNIILLTDKKSLIRVGLVPMGAFLFVNKDLEGGGGAMRLAFWFKKYKYFYPYMAIGAGFGIRDISNEKNQWGWGYIANIGIATKFFKHITMNFELSGIRQINEWESITNDIFAPNFNIGIQF